MPTLFRNAALIDADGETRDGWLLVEGDAIAARGVGDPGEAGREADAVDAGGARLAPGFVDLHGHGGGGSSFDDGVDAIRAGLRVHRQHGTTRSVVSLVANPIETLAESLRAVREVAAGDPLVLGAHLEGPFLAARRRGAHAEQFLRAPDPEAVEALIEAGGGAIRQITMAPELPGALDAVDRLVAAGVVVAVGHTDADLDRARAAFDRGARMLTHAFNAMPGLHHREPGPLAAAFDDERVTVEIIADGIHVHPAVLDLAFRAAPGRIALVTDAMAAAGTGDGAFRIGSLDVTVAEGRAVLAGTDTLAGSTLTQDVALRTAVLAAGVAPVAAVDAVTRAPAAALGLDDRLGLLRPGYAADLVLLDDDWRVRGVWAAGERIATT